MKKKDIFLVGGILILALLCWLVPKGLRLVDGNKETELKITVAGEVYGTYSLEKNQVIKIQDTNVCEIKDGKVKDIDNALVITTGNGSYGYPLQERVAS